MKNRGIKNVLKLAALAITLPYGGFAAASQAKPVIVTSVVCDNGHGLAKGNAPLARGDARVDAQRESADAVLTGRACTPPPAPCEEAPQMIDLHASVSALTGDCHTIMGRTCDGELLGNGSAAPRNLPGTFQTISAWVQNRVMAVELLERD